MQQFTKNALFFVIGGVGYGIIELLWRGRTHWAMLVAGGICFICFSDIAERFKGRSLWFKAAVSAVVVTAVELVFGVFFNMILHEDIWDYSRMPFNLWGQICPLFSLLWGILGLAFIPLADRLNGYFKKQLKLREGKY